MRRARFGLVCLVAVATLATGCSRSYWRRNADSEAYGLIREKTRLDARWAPPRSDVLPSPLSRNFDPADPDYGSLPPDDPYARRFMHRMSEVVEVGSHVRLIEDDIEDIVAGPAPDQRAELPAGVEVFRIAGPLFFAVASRLDDALSQIPPTTRVFILRTRLVPLIDASGVASLVGFLDSCASRGVRVIVSGLRPQPRETLERMGVLSHHRRDDRGAALAHLPP